MVHHGVAKWQAEESNKAGWVLITDVKDPFDTYFEVQLALEDATDFSLKDYFIELTTRS